MSRNTTKSVRKSRVSFLRPWSEVNWVVFNSHVGQGIRQGGLDWVMENWLPSVILVQEAKLVNLERYKERWHVVHYGHNVILADKTVFDLAEHGGPDIRYGSQYVRNRVYAVLLHKELKRTFYVQDVHLDPLAPTPDLSLVKGVDRRERHMKQGLEYVQHAGRWLNARNAIHADGGDFNEFVDEDRLVKGDFFGYSMARRYRRLGMFPAHKLAEVLSGPLRIDDIFFKTAAYFRVLSRESVDLSPIAPGLDHHSVLIKTVIRPRLTWTWSARQLLKKVN